MTDPFAHADAVKALRELEAICYEEDPTLNSESRLAVLAEYLGVEHRDFGTWWKQRDQAGGPRGE